MGDPPMTVTPVLRDPDPEFRAILFGDSLFDGTIKRANENVQEGAATLSWGWRAVEKAAATMDRTARILNHSFGGYNFSTIRFPATILGVLYDTIDDFRTLSGRESYPGSLLPYTDPTTGTSTPGMFDRATMTREFGAFVPQLAIMQMGTNDRSIPQTDDLANWEAEITADMTEILRRIRLEWSPAPSLLVISPHVVDLTSPSLDIVDRSIEAAATAAGWGSTADIYFAHLTDIIATAPASLGTFEVHPNAEQHEWIADQIEIQIRGIMNFNAGGAALKFNEARNSQYVAGVV